MKYTSKCFLGWNAVEEYINCIESAYKNFPLSGVYGLPRGGLVLAVMISHRLDIPLLQAPYPDCLIVDDICDSGESLMHYVNNSSSPDKPNYYVTTMIYNQNCPIKVDISWKDKSHFEKSAFENAWIVFPWET